MKTNIKSRILQSLLIILLILIPKKIFSQTSFDFVPLFEVQTENLNKRVLIDKGKLICEINKSIISKFDLEDKPFAFLKGIDDKSFALIKYHFGRKDEKSNFELYLLDGNFRVSFYRKYYFHYEEPLPKILPLNSNEVMFFYPYSGRMKLINNRREREIDLIKNENQELFQERIGHLIPYGEKILVTLSQLKKYEKFFSKIFLLDIETFEFKSYEIDIPIIHKIILEKSNIYLTAITTEPVFNTGFYILEIDNKDIKKIKLEKISDDFIDGIVKNSDNLFFGKNCFYVLKNKILEKIDFCIEDEIILDVLLINKSIFLVTRKDLTSYLYKLDNNFSIIEREPIERYLSNPELRLSLDKKLYLIDQNRTILMKNLLEER